ncbi:hypothetical protein U5801_12450 [Lamprobacter modestohalophilus]|uniref:hypothetical protein n=1 Tax=Lamprobacter modestohalophilus TaxID=1064514 RepID=UPI002ADEBDA8|nr:hypothetical protein [Lamprobacter modestohalophilus]MEA1050610.1 hypothetical protein [Lamprobacter modestohalophilus]
MSIKLPIPILILILILILLLPAIAGCSTLIQRTEHGRWVEIGPASTLTLHQPVAIPQDRARVFISNGQISRNSANYRTSCALEVRELSRQGPQLVSPGRFQITRAQHYWTEVAANLQEWQVFVQIAELSNGGGQPLIQTGYRFWLERADQLTETPVYTAAEKTPKAPNVTHLTCLGILAEPAEAYPPTISELEQALGSLATLRL